MLHLASHPPSAGSPDPALPSWLPQPPVAAPEPDPATSAALWRAAEGLLDSCLQLGAASGPVHALGTEAALLCCDMALVLSVGPAPPSAAAAAQVATLQRCARYAPLAAVQALLAVADAEPGVLSSTAVHATLSDCLDPSTLGQQAGGDPNLPLAAPHGPTDQPVARGPVASIERLRAGLEVLVRLVSTEGDSERLAEALIRVEGQGLVERLVAVLVGCVGALRQIPGSGIGADGGGASSGSLRVAEPPGLRSHLLRLAEEGTVALRMMLSEERLRGPVFEALGLLPLERATALAVALFDLEDAGAREDGMEAPGCPPGGSLVPGCLRSSECFPSAVAGVPMLPLAAWAVRLISGPPGADAVVERVVLFRSCSLVDTGILARSSRKKLPVDIFS